MARYHPATMLESIVIVIAQHSYGLQAIALYVIILNVIVYSILL